MPMKKLVLRLFFLILGMGILIHTMSNGYPAILRKPIVFIVPVMNRDEQVDAFEEHMCSVWNSSFPLQMWVMNQTNDWSFSRSWLFNVGLDLVLKKNMSCVVIHDVDLLPLNDVAYHSCLRPTHLYTDSEDPSWRIPYPSFSGGVFVASPSHWVQINGMSNKFRGWGGEDDEMFARFRLENLTMDHVTPHRAKGRFRKNLKHHFRKPKVPAENEENLKLLLETNMKRRDYKLDGLAQVKYTIVNHVKVNRCDIKIFHLDVV
jgi:xylosylprotein 4-beta-galactosyltransferase